MQSAITDRLCLLLLHSASVNGHSLKQVDAGAMCCEALQSAPSQEQLQVIAHGHMAVVFDSCASIFVAWCSFAAWASM